MHIVPLSEASYYVKLTAREAMIGRLRRAQELLSHAIPDGDIVEIIDRALILIIEERRNGGGTRRPIGHASRGRGRIRPVARSQPMSSASSRNATEANARSSGPTGAAAMRGGSSNTTT